MTFACQIWSRGLPARLAAGAARMSGPIGNRLKHMRDRGWRRQRNPVAQAFVRVQHAGARNQTRALQFVLFAFPKMNTEGGFDDFGSEEC